MGIRARDYLLWFCHYSVSYRSAVSLDAREPGLPPAGKGFTSAKSALASRRQAGQGRLMGQWLKLSLKTE